MRKYVRYKDSGISWIGEVPEHWDVIPMKRLFVNRKSGAWGEDELHNDLDRICLRIADFDMTELRFKRNIDYTIRNYKQDVIEKCALKKGDILVEKSGGGEKTPVGRAVLYDLTLNEPLFANFMDRLRCSESINPYYVIFLWNMMNSKGAVWNYVKQTTGIQNLDIGALLSAENVCTPPLPEQKAIAEYLDKKTAQINELVSAKQKQIELLKEYKQSVIANAVTGKIDERREKRKWKDSGISWIGKIPENWEIKRAKYMFKKEKRDVRDSDDVVTCFRDGEVTLRKNRRTSGFTESITEIGYQGIRKNDLVIHQMDAFAGAIGVSDSDGKGTSVYHCCTPLGDYDVRYYASLLRIMAKKGFIQSLYRGIRERSSDFNFQVFGKQYLVVPPLSEQKEIVAYIEKKVSSIDSQIASIENQIANLNEYKQSLISDVVTGKVKV